MKKEPQNTTPLPLHILTFNGAAPYSHCPIYSRAHFTFCTLTWSREVSEDSIESVRIGTYSQSLYKDTRTEHYDTICPTEIYAPGTNKRYCILCPVIDYDIYEKRTHWQLHYVRVALTDGTEYRIEFKIYRYGKDC